jgi:hypothetical protein
VFRWAPTVSRRHRATPIEGDEGLMLDNAESGPYNAEPQERVRKNSILAAVGGTGVLEST